MGEDWCYFNTQQSDVDIVFYVKDGIIYGINCEFHNPLDAGASYRLMKQYSNGRPWKYVGVGALPQLSDWEREDHQASCEMMGTYENGYDAFTFSTKLLDQHRYRTSR